MAATHQKSAIQHPKRTHNSVDSSQTDVHPSKTDPQVSVQPQKAYPNHKVLSTKPYFDFNALLTLIPLSIEGLYGQTWYSDRQTLPKMQKVFSRDDFLVFPN
jgi:hypothetical protein